MEIPNCSVPEQKRIAFKEKTKKTARELAEGIRTWAQVVKENIIEYNNQPYQKQKTDLWIAFSWPSIQINGAFCWNRIQTIQPPSSEIYKQNRGVTHVYKKVILLRPTTSIDAWVPPELPFYTWARQTYQRNVNIMAVSFLRHDELNVLEVLTTNQHWATRSWCSKFLNWRDLAVKNLIKKKSQSKERN